MSKFINRSMKSNATAKSFKLSNDLIERWNELAKRDLKVSYNKMLHEALELYLDSKGIPKCNTGISVVLPNEVKSTAVESHSDDEEEYWTEEEAEMFNRS
jgi:hypothetical protein